MPDGNDIDVFRQAIEMLPATESPEVFGLHPNADITFRALQVQEGISTILDTMPKGAGGGGGLSREEIVDRICEDLLAKVRRERPLGAPLAAPCSTLDALDTLVSVKHLQPSLLDPLLFEPPCFPPSPSLSDPLPSSLPLPSPGAPHV